MKKIKIIFYNIFLMNIFFFLFVCSIDALDVVGQGNINFSNATYSTSTGSCSAADWQGCITFPYPIGYRITLVVKNGRKVDGTRSVDFMSSVDSLNSLRSLSSGGVTYRYDKIFDTPRYKYSTYYKDDSMAQNGINDFVAIYYNSADGYGYSPNQNNLSGFIKDLENYNDKSSSLWGLYDLGDTAEVANVSEKNLVTKNKYPFLDVFLHYCGFLESNDRTLIKLEANYDKWLRFTDKENPLYLLIEPTYFVFYNETSGILKMVHKYGTITEIAEKMWSGPFNGLKWGLATYIRDNRACDLSTPKVENGLQTVNQNGVFQNPWDSHSCIYKRDSSFDGRSVWAENLNGDIAYLRDPQWGYGVYVINLSDKNLGCPNNDCPRPNITFDADYCLNNDGLVSFGPSENVIISENDLINGFDYNGKHVSFDNNSYSKETEPENKIACYDSVSYDFSKTMKALDTSINKSIYLDIPLGTANVVRKCWVGENVKSNYTKDEVVKNYLTKDSGSNDNYVRIKAFRDTDYDFVPILDAYSEDWVNSSSGNKGFLVTYRFTINYIMFDQILVPDNPKASKFYLKFPTNAFGESNKFFDVDGRAFINFSDAKFKNESKRKLTDDSERCYFNNLDYRSSNLKFRVISLDDPFPARDGTARLPGKNWLSDNKNGVFDYISNNRGILYNHRNNPESSTSTISPEIMYSESEPMYSITLTPSTMLRIRSYNIENNYDSMNPNFSGNMQLFNENGMNCELGMCVSNFLRNTYYIPSDSLSGACVKSLNDLKKVEFEDYTEKDVYETVYSETNNYKSEYDFNKNGRMDSDDYEISRDINRGKNTVFYTCANKSYLSSGLKGTMCDLEGKCYSYE